MGSKRYWYIQISGPNASRKGNSLGSEYNRPLANDRGRINVSCGLFHEMALLVALDLGHDEALWLDFERMASNGHWLR